jgi:hypothetical protein
MGANTSIKGGIVFEDPDNFFDNVESSASRLQKTPPRLQGLGDSITMRANIAIGDVPCSSVNTECAGQNFLSSPQIHETG